MSTAEPPQGARPPDRREAPVRGDSVCGLVRVAAAVLLRPDGQVLLAQRPPGKPYAGYWEFPGGKLEAGETPRAALARELEEELGVVVRRASPWLVQEFVYPHAHVELHFFRVYAWDGELHGHDGQAFAWQVPGRYTVAPLLPANTRILSALELPGVYGITCAADGDEEAFLVRAARALADGLRLVQIRDKEWPRARRLAFARRLVPLAHRHGARVLWNGTADDARAANCDGVHWTAEALRAARARPDGMLVAASCHTRDEVAHAGRLDLDFAVLGPVAATPSHPAAAPIGWEGFAARVAENRLPVYALGGLAAGDLDHAIACGAQGVALRRGAWPA
jgi:8-oxo-dGTP diphosphatase